VEAVIDKTLGYITGADSLFDLKLITEISLGRVARQSARNEQMSNGDRPVTAEDATDY